MNVCAPRMESLHCLKDVSSSLGNLKAGYEMQHFYQIKLLTVLSLTLEVSAQAFYPLDMLCTSGQHHQRTCADSFVLG